MQTRRSVVKHIMCMYLTVSCMKWLIMHAGKIQVLKIVPRNCKQDKTVAYYFNIIAGTAATKDTVYCSNSLTFCKMQWLNSIKC